MHLESANVLQLQFVRGSTEIAAELRNRADVGSLCRWRKIADGHVLDHAVAQRAHLGHLEISCLGAGCNTRSSQTGGQLSDLAARAAIAASFNPLTYIFRHPSTRPRDAKRTLSTLSNRAMHAVRRGGGALGRWPAERGPSQPPVRGF